MKNYIVDITDYDGFREAEMTQAQLETFYRDSVGHSQYNDFDCWLFDMSKMGLVRAAK